MILRNYQQFTISELFRYFEEGGKGNPIAALPTGTGKSIIIAGFIVEVFRRYFDQHIVNLTHVKELIEQNFRKLLELWPTAPAGIFSAGLGRREHYAHIVYAGIASAYECPELFGHVDLVIIDECHLVSPKETTMYQTFLAALRAVNPMLKVIGLTATHYRLGQGYLIDDGGLFTDIAVDLTTYENFNWFLDEGYLVPLVPRATNAELDVANVPIQKGEYNLAQLQLAVDKKETTEQALREAISLSSGRAHWLVFASGIDHAEHVCYALNDLGITAAVVHSKMSSVDRDSRIAAFKDGTYTALVNNGILTTGFDFPAIDMIIVLRPTQSPGLWVQMLGRGDRPCFVEGFDLTTKCGRLASIAASNKQKCLVLDFAGNTRRLGPINDPVLPRKKGKGIGRAPVRLCENCGVYCHTSVRVCPECHYIFPVRTKFGATASCDALIKRDALPELVDFIVDRVVYATHCSKKGAPSLKVSYHCGLRVFKSYVCFEHAGFPRHKAAEWWRNNPTSSYAVPETVNEALNRSKELAAPKCIQVWLNKEYPEVRDYVY
jgi:DNA repair protein RadD